MKSRPFGFFSPLSPVSLPYSQNLLISPCTQSQLSFMVYSYFFFLTLESCEGIDHSLYLPRFWSKSRLSDPFFSYLNNPSVVGRHIASDVGFFFFSLPNLGIFFFKFLLSQLSNFFMFTPSLVPFTPHSRNSFSDHFATVIRSLLGSVSSLATPVED